MNDSEIKLVKSRIDYLKKILSGVDEKSNSYYYNDLVCRIFNLQNWLFEQSFKNIQQSFNNLSIQISFAKNKLSKL